MFEWRIGNCGLPDKQDYVLMGQSSRYVSSPQLRQGEEFISSWTGRQYRIPLGCRSRLGTAPY